MYTEYIVQLLSHQGADVRMAEWVLGVLYQIVAAIGRILGWFVSELVADKICHKIEYYFTDETKLEKNVKMLAGQKWFDELTKDYRYSYIIWNNKRISRYLCENTNIRLLEKHEEEQKKFIDMVKQEHRKFAGISSSGSQ